MDEEFWDAQKQLPLRKRDGLWWLEVALSNTVMWLIAAVVSLAAAGALIDLLRSIV